MSLKRIITATLVGVFLLLGVTAHALKGSRLSVQGIKGYALLEAIPEHNGNWLSLKDAVLFVGAKVTWKSTPRVLVVEYGGQHYRMAIDHPFLYVRQKRRVALEEGLQWKRGEILLSRRDLRLLLREMGVPEFILRDASEADLAAGKPHRGKQAEPKVQRDAPPKIIPKGPEAPERQAKGRLKLVVIDAGHGGKDSGALGRKHTKEKNICLDIAKRLGALIKRQEPSIKVVLTRKRDRFISLKKRTQIANDAGADLFISIHNNASPDRHARGTQVFFYDSQSSNRHAARLARSENSDANLLDVVFTDLLKTQVRDDSIELAASIQRDLSKALKTKSRRLHYAPFYVLAQTRMPSVLVEAAFLSNSKEENLLRNKNFREKVALGIFRGIRNYHKETLASQ